MDHLLTRLGTEKAVGRKRVEDCLKRIPFFPEAQEAVREAAALGCEQRVPVRK